MGPTAQRCSHQLHSAATLERRSHCPVAPAGPLLFVIGTIDRGQYIYIICGTAHEKKGRREKKGCVKARLGKQNAGELTSRYFAR